MPLSARRQAVFEEADGVDKGLGPLYNARSCADCHQNPVTGGGSQVAEFRVGHLDNNGRFRQPIAARSIGGQDSVPNRSLANDRAVCPEAQERVPASENVRTFRMSLGVLGDGFVEAIDDTTLQNIAAQQSALSKGKIHGEFITGAGVRRRSAARRPVWLEESACQPALVRFGCLSQRTRHHQPVQPRSIPRPFVRPTDRPKT